MFSVLCLGPAPTQAADERAAKPAAAAKPAKAAKPARQRAARRKQAPAPIVPAAASPEQIAASERVFYGMHQCEFDQSVDVAVHPEWPAYVSVKFAKATYVMRPVLSSTGAVRLEDVQGETLMVQITAKSMLLNVKAGRRLVDECISAKHREAMAATSLSEAAASAAARAAAAGAAEGASSPGAAD